MPARSVSRVMTEREHAQRGERADVARVSVELADDVPAGALQHGQPATGLSRYPVGRGVSVDLAHERPRQFGELTDVPVVLGGHRFLRPPWLQCRRRAIGSRSTEASRMVTSLRRGRRAGGESARILSPATVAPETSEPVRTGGRYAYPVALASGSGSPHPRGSSARLPADGCVGS
jgi:hypothetical protein